MAGEQMNKDQFIHYDVVKMKLTYLVDVDVDILDNLCGDHKDQYDALDTYVEDFVDVVQGCDDCNQNRVDEAFKQADYVEITKFDLPHDVDIVD